MNIAEMLFEIAPLLFLGIVASGLAGQPFAEEGSCGPCQTSLLENVTISLSAMKNEIKQERNSQHEEVMYISRQILEAIGKKEDPEVVGEPRDCADLFKAGERENGIYRIKADRLKEGFDVYCDMEKEGGGWIVIQRRGNFGSSKHLFQKSWADYKTGFGQLDKDFWLGNEKISALSRQESYELHVDMWDYEGMHYNASYKLFRVESEEHYFTLHVGVFSGNTYDCLQFSNGMRFATFDRDVGTCAQGSSGPFWHAPKNPCSMTTLNGIRDPESRFMFYWYGTNGMIYLSSAEMMIKPLSFPDS